MHRIAHCRFAYEGSSKKLTPVRKGEPYDKIVSIVWSLDINQKRENAEKNGNPEGNENAERDQNEILGTLKYGAVVYKKSGKIRDMASKFTDVRHTFNELVAHKNMKLYEKLLKEWNVIHDEIKETERFQNAVKSGDNDFWNKKRHMQTAMQRYRDNPVKVQIRESAIPLESMENLSIDFYIAEKLIFLYGVSSLNTGDCVHTQDIIYEDFNELYDPRGSVEDVEDTTENEKVTDDIRYLSDAFLYGFILPVGAVLAASITAICLTF